VRANDPRAGQPFSAMISGMALNKEVETWEAEMLRAYVEVVDQVRDQIASAGLTAEEPALRRWNEDDPAAYGSEIEMSLLRNGEIDEALDVLLYVRGQRQRLTPIKLKAWVIEEIKGLAAP
jgi:hypothetical protein